jgi:beta-hydroxylase
LGSGRQDCRVRILAASGRGRHRLETEIMSASDTRNERLTGLAWLKRRRRRYIKKLGKHLIRALAGFLGRQGVVEDKPVLGRKGFGFLQPFEDNWQTIKAELDEVLKFRDAVPAFQEISPDQKKISKGDSWKTFILFGFGQKLEKNCLLTPETAKLLGQVPNIQSAWFSILAPGYHIPAHRGVTKGILRCHLGLIIPKQAEKCRMRVADEICVWQPGELFVFDDTYDHEVWNETKDERVILLFDFDRPMRFWGRFVNKTFLRLMRFTAYYQEPKKNLQTFEERFAAATRRADANLEKMGD